jgi:hypothetical protein
MSASQEDCGELVQRVKRLERQNRMWRISGLAAIMALAAAITASAWAQQYPLPRGAHRELRIRTVEAEHFILKSETGQTEGELTVTPQGPVINLYGMDGRVIWSTRGGARPVDGK